jgi:hypothetical protein
VPQAVERLGAPEFSKDELTRLKEFMTKIGEKVDSIDGVIRDFERIDTTRKGTITAEQVIAFERSSSEQAVPAQPLMLDQTEAISPLAKAPMESYLNKYTVEPEQKTSTFERSE